LRSIGGRLRRTGFAEAVIETAHRDIENLRHFEKPSRADAVRAALVLLDLLERNPEPAAELGLAHAMRFAQPPDLAADHRIMRASSAHAVFFRTGAMIHP
jgi:hypothetical protein